MVVFQVSLAVSPAVRELGVALMVMAGAGVATVTVVDWIAVPPGPVQVSVNSVVAVSGAVVWDPLVPTLPLQPPEAMQVLAPGACQFSTVVMPAFMVVDCAARLTEGVGGSTVTSAD